ncbi:MAG: hypothetical protein ACRC91_16125 [Aeromonas sp.]
MAESAIWEFVHPVHPAVHPERGERTSHTPAIPAAHGKYSLTVDQLLHNPSLALVDIPARKALAYVVNRSTFNVQRSTFIPDNNPLASQTKTSVDAVVYQPLSSFFLFERQKEYYCRFCPVSYVSRGP